MDELTLYQTDRPKWLKQVAPRYAQQLARMDDGAMARAWGELPRDYQAATWAHLDASTQARLRKVRL